MDQGIRSVIKYFIVFLLVECLTYMTINTSIIGIIYKGSRDWISIFFIEFILYGILSLIINMKKQLKAYDEMGYIIFLSAIAFTFGWIGYVKVFYPIKSIYKFLEMLYCTIQLFAFSTMSDIHVNDFLNIGRFLAVVSVSGAIVILIANKILEKAIINTRYKKHLIICSDYVDEKVISVINANNRRNTAAF